MKIVLLTLVLAFQAFAASAQAVSISNDKSNIVFIGIPNPLTVTVENYSCDDIVLETANGMLTKRDGHHYELMVTNNENVTIEVFVKDGRKLKKVDQYLFKAKPIPPPVAQLGGKSGGVMPTVVFKAQLGLVARMENFDFDMRFKITDFYMVVRRGDKVIFGHGNEGARFDETIKHFMSELKKGDKINFVDINCKGGDDRKRATNSIQLLLQ